MKLLLGNILVTGVLGFIGSHFIRHTLSKESSFERNSCNGLNSYRWNNTAY